MTGAPDDRAAAPPGDGPPAAPVPLPVAAAAVTVVPVAVLALQAAALLAGLVPALPVATIQVAAVVVAAAAAALGVRRAPRARLGVLRGLARRALTLAVLAIGAAGVVAVAGDDATPVVGPVTAGVLVVLGGAFGAGHGVGDAYRRQVRVAATAEQRRDADRALPLRVLLATGLSLALGVVGELTGIAPGGSAVARWLPVTVLVAGLVGVGAVRQLVLRSRVERTVGALGAAWRSGTVRLGLVVLTLVALGGAVLLAGGERWLADALPDPPGWPDTALTVDRAAPDASDGAPDRLPPSAPEPWQVLAVVALVVAALVVTRRPGRRRLRPGPVGQRLPLWELVRAVLAMLRPQPDEQVGEETPVAPPAPRARDDAALPAPVRRLVARLRPRPREPAAAILHDYRAVQRHLDRPDRRAASETPLHHAGRLAVEDLRELADLVCDVRYAGRSVTGADADRSRELTRRLLRR